MNYRHAYHAGNHTEVFKHAVLLLILEWLRVKPKPFMVLDTHAGLGRYDLRSNEAVRTGEASDGVLRVLASRREALAPYVTAVSEAVRKGEYPGSPAIIAKMLREGDRLIACELHPEDASTLRMNMADDPRVAVHWRDGYEAVGAFVPPLERRGLVFIDPPFESRDEPIRLGRTLARGIRKWPTGCFVGWYPVKSDHARGTIAGILEDAAIPNSLCAEFLRYPMDGVRLAGGGLVIINPPWRLDEALRRLCADMADAFGGQAGAGRVDWLAPPA